MDDTSTLTTARNHRLLWLAWGLRRLAIGCDASRCAPTAIRAVVLARDGHRCVRCGRTDALQIDHIWPWSLGGPTRSENLQTLCGACNRWKSDYGGDYRPRVRRNERRRAGGRPPPRDEPLARPPCA